MKKRFFVVLIIFITIASCKKDAISGYEHNLNPNLGANSTIADVSPLAFSHASPTLSGDDELQFFVGNSLFNKNWVSAPASTTARDGLGPLFNARSCASCHFKDGRGRTPSAGELATGYLIRLSIDGANHPEYGDQLQDQANLGIKPEASFVINYFDLTGTYDDGSTYTLRNPSIAFSDFKYSVIGSETQTSPRVAPQMIGLGLLETIPSSMIESWTDENDADQNGISGRVNRVYDIEKGQLEIGRFGWKSNAPNIKQQCAGAFYGDMGLTSSMHPDEDCVTGDCAGQPNGGNPEVEEKALNQVALYSRNLAVPQQRNFDSETVKRGYDVFVNTGCNDCHKSNIELPDGRVISPFTDLLLHDMGEALADNRPDNLANGNEWRTAPLWGIGLISVVNNHEELLHDGRARNIEEAILWHGGEAEASQKSFKALDKNKREDLLNFLKSI